MSTSRSLSMQVSGGSGGTRRVDAGGHDATLGRAPDCTLVLPDDQRVISRVQARIEWRGGNCVLVDLGSNPTLVNGHALDGSREAVLRSGDTLRIGAYSVAVVTGPRLRTRRTRCQAVHGRSRRKRLPGMGRRRTRP